MLRAPSAGSPASTVHWKIHIPSPRKKKEWLEFWAIYRREKRLLEQFQNDPRIKEITLDPLNQHWMRTVSPRSPAHPFSVVLRPDHTPRGSAPARTGKAGRAASPAPRAQK